MKSFWITLLLTLCLKSTFAQKVLFTTSSAIQDSFWLVDVNNPLVYQSITTQLEPHCTGSGIHKGPITTSHNGSWYIFQSERFDAAAQGWEAITICRDDYSVFEVPKDAMGNVFHAEGIMQISNDGQTIYFVQSGSAHARDIFKITKNGTYWNDPINLTETTSTFDYNLSPYLSYSETELAYEASSMTYPITDLRAMDHAGGNASTLVSTSSIAGCSQVKSPAFTASGTLIFEAETDAERIWMLPVNGSPTVIDALQTNDNSPVTLPDGRIASLYLPAGTHQVKVMNASGGNVLMCTASNAQFYEAFDIGISAGASGPASVQDASSGAKQVAVYPNPTTGTTFVEVHEPTQVTCFNALGQPVQTYLLNEGVHQLNFSALEGGVYGLQFKTKRSMSTEYLVMIGK